MRLLTVLLLAATPALAVEVPSGQPVELQEVLVDQLGEETWLRFRFVAPNIGTGGQGIAYGVAADDMQHLCDNLALSYAAEYALSGDVIVISLADRPTEFGAASPDATQFFEAYRVKDDLCIWEGL